MVDRIGYRVTGLTSVVRGLIAMGVEVEDLKDAFQTLAALGAESVRRHTPRKSGRLAGDVRGNRARSKAVVTAGRASVPYAGAINYGWAVRGIEPAYFMQAADAEIGPRAIPILEDSINRRIRARGLNT